MRKPTATLPGRWRTDEAGTVLLVAGLVLPILLFAAAMSLDFATSLRIKTNAQTQIDAAALAAVGAPTQDAALSKFQAYLSARKMNPAKAQFSWQVKGTNVEVTATYTDKANSATPKLLGRNGTNYAVSTIATAPLKAHQIELKMKDAYGWFNKSVRFFVQRADGTTEQVASLDYTMTDHTGAGWRGTGITVISPSPTVSLGDFKSLWAEMTVNDTTAQQIITYSTRDPQTVNHLFIDGVQLPLGAPAALGTLLPCERTVEYSWEDSDDGWSTQDIFFDLKTACSVPDPSRVRLTR